MKFWCCLFSAFLLNALSGCKSDVETPSTTTGTISGYVHLYDSQGNNVSSAGGVVVSVSGTNTSVQSNDSGKWSISGLSSGIYTLDFSKTGYGSSKIIAYQFIGGGTAYPGDIALSQPPVDGVNFQAFTILSSNNDSTRSATITATVPPPFTKSRSFVLCMSTDSASLAMDPSSAQFVSFFIASGSGYDGTIVWSSSTIAALTTNQIPKGARVFATVAIVGEGSNEEFISAYFDPQRDREVYTALGRHSQLLSAKMP